MQLVVQIGGTPNVYHGSWVGQTNKETALFPTRLLRETDLSRTGVHDVYTDVYLHQFSSPVRGVAPGRENFGNILVNTRTLDGFAPTHRRLRAGA